MTNKEKSELDKQERQMRENAYSIKASNERMKDIDREAARKALLGIIDYLNELYNES